MFYENKGSVTVISAKPCQNAFGQIGTCMFMWDCIKSEGLHLGTCSDRFLFGSCCYYNTTFNDVDIQRPTSPSVNGNKNNTNDSSNSYTNLTSTVVDLKPQSSSMNNIVHQSPLPSQLQSSSSLSTTSFLQSTSTLSDHFDSILTHKSNSTTSPSGSFIDHENDWKITTYDRNNNTLQAYRPNIGASSINNNNNNNLDTQTTTLPAILNNDNSTIEQDLSSTSNIQQQHYPITTSTLSTVTTLPTTPYSSNNQETTSPQRPIFTTLKPNSYINQAHETSSTTIGYSPSQQQQEHGFTTNHMTPQAPPQRPSSWLSRPALTLANALIHSFKPFPYLNPYPNRLRPTYKPFSSGYRPQQHYRPMLAGVSLNNNNNHNNQAQQQTKPSLITNNVNQQLEMVSSSSENSFMNSYNNSVNVAQTLNPTNSTAISSDNNDHHIVNPSSTMTDRHRPIDKTNPSFNQFNDALVQIDSLNQNQHHYEILNTSSALTNNSSSYNQQTNLPYNHSYMTTIQYEPIHLNQQSSTNMQTNNINSMMTTDQPTSSIDYNNNPISPTSSYQDYQNSKPAVMLEQNHNDTISYPNYSLLSTQLNPLSSENTYPISSATNDIHHSTLTTNEQTYIIPNRENHTTIPISNDFQRPHQHQQLTEYNVVEQHPTNIVASSSSLDQKPTTSSILTPIESIELPPPPSTTQAMIFSTMNTVEQTTPSIIHNTVTVPSTVPTIPPKITSINGVDINKKGSSSKEVTCGVTASYPQTKVVGGKNAAFGAWPWQVSVRKVSYFGFTSTHRCGGAVISSEWIATAGHCVEDLPLQSIRIRVGEHDFSSVAEPFPFIERAARRKVVHPKYNFYTYENDLALVQLDQPIQFPPHVAPICLPPDNIDLLGRNATVTGWGRLNEGGTLPTILQEVRVPIVSNDKCKDMFLSAGRPEYIPDIFLCAGYEEGGRDSCQGDSGGPLQVKGDDGKWFLAGIISWGIGCAEQNLPGVCTRISRFKLWIQSTMNASS